MLLEPLIVRRVVFKALNLSDSLLSPLHLFSPSPSLLMTVRARLNLIESIWEPICIINDKVSIS